MGMFHYFDLGYSEVFVFDDYIINQIRKDKVISTEQGFMLNDIIKTYFNNKKMVYISNKVKSYHVDPLAFKYAENIPNLAAMIIVNANNDNTVKKIPLQDFKKPFKICKSLTDAIVIADAIIKNEPMPNL
ncbi:hypothetical protein [Lacinutrix sp. MedPE-SW]|uniref:hypothetical protein n=1 Tax=Lacinutrix sp. MedPE-SW TaxID=1860087 RepID=UPI00090FAF38|nr:hypothetical protein [Lacinutrix sp. MedPE-SW]OIQ16992.1 MAG: hypothetical protein BM549_13050 [Lacinutrix sp. MedPE-SW]